MTILTLSNLTKLYDGQVALEDVSLSVREGERVALLGHNGAGKSTLMKLVLGLIPADLGLIDVAGHHPGSAGARSATAYLPENVAFHPALSGREQIRHYLKLRGDDPRKADGLLEKVGLGDAATRRIGTYSKGMRQRVGLAQALIGTPRLMILDEPTSGLDPISRREFYALLDDLATQGTAVLLSSHALSELEARTDRIVILAKGKLVAQGPLRQLRDEAALPLRVTLLPHPGQQTALATAFPDAKSEGDMLALYIDPRDKLSTLEQITSRRDLISDFDFQAASLDDLYARISGGAA